MLLLKDLVADTYTNAAGFTLFNALENEITKGTDLIYLSFDGAHCTSSSFLNSSIGALIDKYGIEVLQKIKPVKLSSTQADVLKKYVQSAIKMAKN